MKTFNDFMTKRITETTHPLVSNTGVGMNQAQIVKQISSFSGIDFPDLTAKLANRFQRFDRPMDLLHKGKLHGQMLEIQASFQPVDYDTIKKHNLDRGVTGGADKTNYANTQIIVDIGEEGYHKTLRVKNNGKAKSIETLKEELKIVGDAMKSSKSVEDFIAKLVAAKYKSF